MIYYKQYQVHLDHKRIEIENLDNLTHYSYIFDDPG